MKIGLFTDAHYSYQELTCGKRRNRLSLGKLREGYAFFAEQNCGLCISLGDLIDKNDSHEDDIRHLKEIREVIASSGIETVCLMGNHDAFTFEKEDYYRILGGCEPTDRLLDGKRLLFPDSCYFQTGERYTPAGGDWTDCFLPGENAFLARLSENESFRRSAPQAKSIEQDRTKDSRGMKMQPHLRIRSARLPVALLLCGMMR